jgi:hypothetical protein
VCGGGGGGGDSGDVQFLRRSALGVGPALVAY